MELPKEVGSKQKMVWPIVYMFFSRKEKDCSLDCKKKSDNINTLIQSKLNVRTVNVEFNQYDDFLKLFLYAHYQYHYKLEDLKTLSR